MAAYDLLNPYDIFPRNILGGSWWSPELYQPAQQQSSGQWWQYLISGVLILGGIAACFFFPPLGAALIVTGAGGLIGGAMSMAFGGSFDGGWLIGTTVGVSIGLIILAPGLSVTIPSFGWAVTELGEVVLVVAGTTAVSLTGVAVGAGAAGLAAAGYLMMNNTGKGGGFNDPSINRDPNGNEWTKKSINEAQSQARKSGNFKRFNDLKRFEKFVMKSRGIVAIGFIIEWLRRLLKDN